MLSGRARESGNAFKRQRCCLFQQVDHTHYTVKVLLASTKKELLYGGGMQADLQLRSSLHFVTALRRQQFLHL